MSMSRNIGHTWGLPEKADLEKKTNICKLIEQNQENHKQTGHKKTDRVVNVP